MKTVVIIQARMTSSRLPGKVLLPLVGRPVLEHVVTRLKKCKSINRVVVATSTDNSDEPILQWCQENGVPCYRGSLSDVLDRYYQAAKLNQADVVVRITADCPVIDPGIVDEVVRAFLDGNYDYFSLSGGFPDGLDTQIFSFSALERSWQEATLPSEREHVGPYVKNHPGIFKHGSYVKFHDLAHHRWTLDEPRDFDFLQAVFDRLYPGNPLFGASDILALLEKEPELADINAGIIRNEGYFKSLQQDGKR